MAYIDWYIRAGLKPRHLQLLVTLDEFRNTRKAAAALHVTQPAVSKALSELQQGLGVPLFQRHARGLAPTPFGECLVRHARHMLATLAQAGDELHALEHGVSGKTRVGVLPATAASLLPRWLAAMKRMSPATTVLVRESTMDVLLHALRANEIDLIVGTLPGRDSVLGLEEEILMDEGTKVVVRFGHPMANRRTVRLVDLADYPWVLPPAGSLLRDALMLWFQDSHMPVPSNVVESLSISLLRGYLCESDAIGTLPASVATDMQSQGLLAVLPVTPPSLVRPIGMTWLRGQELQASTRLFMDCARQHKQELNPR